MRSAFVTDMNAVRFKLQFEICNLKSEMNMAAQKDLLEAKDLDDLKRVFKKWRRIGWKNVCKLWLEERTPKQLKGEEG